ncbi:hypothetical protein AVEN_147278-1 [Araneus ventricosus]|uniref:Uncharacterized protein n=1 Tax=Araneus ventricosus TaxID=182803 RepID=A0A4Y2LAQ7_ARAVE|nr:hypothetical protein AVEN_147278-1 [Araneus ventricosus]
MVPTRRRSSAQGIKCPTAHSGHIPATSHRVQFCNQIQELKSDQNKWQYKPAKAKSTSEENFTSEETEILLKSSRSIEALLKWAETFDRCNEGLKCSVCQTVLKFNFENGDNFDENNMLLTFRHLKYDLRRHLNTVTHCETAKELSIRERKH